MFFHVLVYRTKSDLLAVPKKKFAVCMFVSYIQFPDEWLSKMLCIKSPGRVGSLLQPVKLHPVQWVTVYNI